MKGITRRKFLASSVIATMYGCTSGQTMVNGSDQKHTKEALPWRNWSGSVVSHPKGRLSPSSEEQLAAYLSSSTGPLRPVGAGHSFAPLVPTDGHIVVIDQLTGLLSHDSEKLTATFAAGTRLADMGPVLSSVGQGMLNLPDIDRQTLAGATATATHGTGIEFKSLSGYITHLRLITPSGNILDLDANTSPDLFDAARVSVGSLGIVSQITLQNRKAYRLKQRSWIEKTEDVLSAFDEHAANHRHFEILPLTHSDYSIVLATDETQEAINNPPASAEEEAAFGAAMVGWMQLPPGERRPHINGLAEMIQPSERVDESYKILSNVRANRFNEMEYSIPLAAGAECLREILRTIAEKKVDVVFPLEYRYVSRDDTMLSMSSGHEDHVAVSVHRVASQDYRPYFDIIEPIFWKYGGRPHWGKIHTLGADQLTELYPDFRRFQAIREKLDPTNRMLNNHLSKLFVGSK
jgi:FAD-linked oxidoreductase